PPGRLRRAGRDLPGRARRRRQRVLTGAARSRVALSASLSADLLIMRARSGRAPAGLCGTWPVFGASIGRRPPPAGLILAMAPAGSAGPAAPLVRLSALVRPAVGMADRAGRSRPSGPVGR